MGKYMRYHSKTPGKKPMHPIWRGIGCILIVFVPLLTFWLMTIFVPMIVSSRKLPYQLLGPVHFPKWILKLRFLDGITGFIGSLDNLWISIITFLVILLILTAVVSISYSMIYAAVGPARYKETDAPPSKYKTKKYTR
jgi:hypothetical protein